ncbi:hypothetical protein [Bradyrhizobium sp. DASA03120]|uniref:hypothetical protein n=1 Tax=Bradyrhizobium sp. SMVTL-02 TaxID=3395917 RepID=UPI003F6E5D72
MRNRFDIFGTLPDVIEDDGISNFDDLQSRKYDDQVQLYAFDMLAGEGDDYRKLPLFLRKQNLAQLLVRYPEGIHAGPFEQGEMGPELFRAACNMGLEGLVSKHRERVSGFPVISFPQGEKLPPAQR